jgi:hypothetical protein
MISRFGAMVGAFLNPDAPTEAFVEGFLQGREFERELLEYQMAEAVIAEAESYLQ